MHQFLSSSRTSSVVAKCYVIPDIKVVAGILQGFHKIKTHFFILFYSALQYAYSKMIITELHDCIM